MDRVVVPGGSCPMKIKCKNLNKKKKKIHDWGNKKKQTKTGGGIDGVRTK